MVRYSNQCNYNNLPSVMVRYSNQGNYITICLLLWYVTVTSVTI